MLSAVDEQQLDLAVTAIGCARPQLVDATEAAVVAESLGYTDARVRRELGLGSVQELGQAAFALLSERPMPIQTRRRAARPASTWPAGAFIASWLAVLAIDRLAIVPGPPLDVAFMLSLIATGGAVVALRERAAFYRDQQQPAVAASVAAYIVRLGIAVVLAFAVVGALIGWMLDVAPWPTIVLAADEFLVFSVLWLVYGGWSSRQSTKSAVALPLPRLTVIAARMLPRVLRCTAWLMVAFAGPLLLADAASRGVWYAAATAGLFAIGAVYRRKECGLQAAPNIGAAAV